MRIVIKVGTSSLLNDDGSGVRLGVLAQLCETVKELRAAGHETVIVSSGAVGMGCIRMGIDRPKEIGKVQAMAAVGGMALSRLFEQAFELTGGKCAQVLLTYSNFGSKVQFRTAKVSARRVCARARVAACPGASDAAQAEMRCSPVGSPRRNSGSTKSASLRYFFSANVPPSPLAALPTRPSAPPACSASHRLAEGHRAAHGHGDHPHRERERCCQLRGGKGEAVARARPVFRCAPSLGLPPARVAARGHKRFVSGALVRGAPRPRHGGGRKASGRARPRLGGDGANSPLFRPIGEPLRAELGAVPRREARAWPCQARLAPQNRPRARDWGCPCPC